MSRPQSPSKDDPSTSLEQLRKQFEQSKQQAAELSTSQADNKRRQEYLKKAIDLIQKNLAEFEKDGAELEKQYAHVEHQLQHHQRCMAEELGESAADIDAALQTIDDELHQQQENAAKHETALTGDRQIAALAAQRAAMRAEKQFELLRVKDLKDRLANVQSLLKEAHALANATPPDLPAAYVLLLLACERLSTSWVVVDFVSERMEFSFPKDYEQRLVAAYAQMLSAREAAVAAQNELAAGKAAFDQEVQQLAAARAARKDRAVEAAQSVGSTPPATASPS
jgi:hypothetical protein